MSASVADGPATPVPNGRPLSGQAGLTLVPQTGDSHRFERLAFSADDQHLVCFDSTHPYPSAVWDLRSQMLVQNLPAEPVRAAGRLTSTSTRVLSAPDEGYMTTRSGSQLNAFDAATGLLLLQLSLPDGAWAASADGHLVAAASADDPCRLAILDVVKRTVTGYAAPVSSPDCVAVGSDGHTVFLGGHDPQQYSRWGVVSFDPTTGQWSQRYPFTPGVRQFGLSEEGRYMWVASRWDGNATLDLGDLTGGSWRPLARGAILFCRFTPDGQCLLACRSMAPAGPTAPSPPAQPVGLQAWSCNVPSHCWELGTVRADYVGVPLLWVNGSTVVAWCAPDAQGGDGAGTLLVWPVGGESRHLDALPAGCTWVTGEPLAGRHGILVRYGVEPGHPFGLAVVDASPEARVTQLGDAGTPFRRDCHSADGGLVAAWSESSGGARLCVWRSDGSILCQQELGRSWLDMAFSPNLQWLACSCNTDCVLVDLRADHLGRALRVPGVYAAGALAFNATSTRLASVGNGAVTVIDVPSQRRLFTLGYRAQALWDIAWDPTGGSFYTLGSGSYGAAEHLPSEWRLKQWDLTSATAVGRSSWVPGGWSADVQSFGATRSSARVVTATTDYPAKSVALACWSPSVGFGNWVLPLPRSGPAGLLLTDVREYPHSAASPNGRYVAVDLGAGSTVAVWDSDRVGNHYTALSHQGAACIALALADDGLHVALGLAEPAAGSSVNAVVLADLSDPEHPIALPMPGGGLPYASMMAFHPNGSLLVLGNSTGDFVAWSAAKRRLLPRPEAVHDGDLVDSLEVDSKGRVVLASRQEAVRWRLGAPGSPEAGKWVVDSRTALDGQQGKCRIDPTGRLLLKLSEDSTVRLWNLEQGELVATFVSGPDDGYAIVTPEGFSTASPGAADTIGYRVGDSIHRFDQFDLVLNRPDIVLTKLLRALAKPPSDLAATYRAQCAKRLPPGATLADPDGSPGSTDWRASAQCAVDWGRALDGWLPIAVSLNVAQGQPTEVVVRGNGLRLQELRDDTGHPLPPDRLACKGPTTLALLAPLVPGANHVAVSLRDASGAEGSPVVTDLFWDAEVAGHTYVATAGISGYKDDMYRLAFAAKDAIRVADRLGALLGLTPDRQRVITDARADSTGIRGLHGFFESSQPSDTAILYLCGHGLLRAGEYRFAAYDTKFDSEDGSAGLSFDDLVQVLDGIPARHRLVLLDSCFAGRAAGPDRGFQSMFAFTRPQAGASVIASCAADARGFLDWEMGHTYFAEALFEIVDNLERLGRLGYASREEKRPTVARLRHELSRLVSLNSNGMQMPVFSQQNPFDDFLVFPTLPDTAR